MTGAVSFSVTSSSSCFFLLFFLGGILFQIIRDSEKIEEIFKQIKTAITKPKIPMKPQLSAEEEKK